MQSITLPAIGMFIGSPVYLDRADYVFQHTGRFYTSWVSEDHDPEWYLDKVIENNQGNLVIFWDGGVTRRCLKARAVSMDLKALGCRVPEPDWKNKRFLSPEDWEMIARHPEREGAGYPALVRKAAEKGLTAYLMYADAPPEWAAKASAMPNFLGCNIGEVFSFRLDAKSSNNQGFNKRATAQPSDPKRTLADMATSFNRNVKAHMRARRRNGWNRFLTTSASFHLDCEVAAIGRDVIPHIECFAFRNLNFGMSLCRGVYRQFDLPLWGAYLAHEHYAYLPYACEHRFRILDAAFLLSYLNGSKITVLESGNWWQQSDHVPDTPMHAMPKVDLGAISRNVPAEYADRVPEARKGYPRLNYDSEICRRYRKALSDFYDFVKTNGTPDGQPQTLLAAIKGRHDFCSQSFSPNRPVAAAYDRAAVDGAWYEGMPERGWDVFRKVFYPTDPVPGGHTQAFLSGTPYGLTDVVSFTALPDPDWLLEHYRALVFTGWNTATPGQYRLLAAYVRGGGTLVAGLAHLAQCDDRNIVACPPEHLLNGGDLTELCGCRVRARGRRMYWALMQAHNGMGLPPRRRFGPCCTHIGELELTAAPDVLAVHDETFEPVLLRHRLGAGTVYFLNVWEYPGALDADEGPGGRIDSNGLLGEIYRHVARRTLGDVYITDDRQSAGPACRHICHATFPSNRTTYLLNVDLERPHRFFLHQGSRVTTVELKPLEFKCIVAPSLSEFR